MFVLDRKSEAAVGSAGATFFRLWPFVKGGRDVALTSFQRMEDFQSDLRILEAEAKTQDDAVVAVNRSLKRSTGQIYFAGRLRRASRRFRASVISGANCRAAE